MAGMNENGIKHIRCGNCGKDVAGRWFQSATAEAGKNRGFLICPACNEGTVSVGQGRLYPGPRPSRDIQELPADVAGAWDEARSAYSAMAFTACEIMCRKILMHVAVDVAGSKEGKSFVQYVNDLETEGYIAKGLKDVIDQVRDRGNIANHELPASTQAQAHQTVTIVEYLLHTIYELPGMALPTPETA